MRQRLIDREGGGGGGAEREAQKEKERNICIHSQPREKQGQRMRA